MNFAQIPDPDTLPPEARERLLATPWFQKIIREHMAGAEITSEYMREQANKPGAQGFKVMEFEIEPGKKSRGLYDIGTGEFVQPDKLRGPDFEPTVKAVKDPTTGQTSSVLMTSSNSAVPFAKAEKPAPMMQRGYEASPVFDESMNIIAHVYAGPDGDIRTVNKGGNDFSMLAGLLGGKPPGAAAPAPAAPAAPAAAPAAPQAAAPQKVDTSFVVKTAEDYARVPKGATYVDPTGKRRTKQ